ncbi:MAG: succinylglutamate desuccinylase/aspartoacylase family protein [Candidatus Thermoplasmatota archaeon]|nr:succinylglutamate desuccinylase/aspartoacylase family protein [Candidatus Thermoplasmatota archaeon]
MKKTLVTAGIHGSEIGSVLTAREIKGWIESRDLPDVEVIPEVNLEAVENKQRENPRDEKDLNRVFPGNEDGTRSERTAHQLFQKAKDFERVIDLHTYGKNSWCVPYMLTDLEKDYNRNFCEKIGLKNAVQTGGKEGQLFIETSKLGIPSIIIEAGGAERYRDELEKVKDAVLSFLIEDYKKIQEEETIFYCHYERLSPEEEGFFEPKKEAGEEVDKGEPIGLLNEKEVRTDFAGFILGMKTTGKYSPDDESVAAVATRSSS